MSALDITFEDKEGLFARTEDPKNLGRAVDWNEVKAKHNGLRAVTPVVAHAQFQDTSKTLAAPQVFAVASGFQTLICNSGVIIEPLMPEGVARLFTANKIRPNSAIDTFEAYIGFQAANTSPQAAFEIGIDIGGALCVLFRSTHRATQETGTYQFYNVPVVGFAAATFLANGGTPVMRSLAGTLSVYNVIIFIKLTTRLE